MIRDEDHALLGHAALRNPYSTNERHPSYHLWLQRQWYALDGKDQT